MKNTALILIVCVGFGTILAGCGTDVGDKVAPVDAAAAAQKQQGKGGSKAAAGGGLDDGPQMAPPGTKLGLPVGGQKVGGAKDAG